MAPRRIGLEAAGQDLAGMVIRSEDEALENVGGPPSVRRGIVLEEFAGSGCFPPTPRFRSWRVLADQLGIVLLNVLGHRRAGAGEIKAAAELIGDEGIVERSGEGGFP